MPPTAKWSQNGTTIAVVSGNAMGIAVDQQDGTAFVAEYLNRQVTSVKPGENQSRLVDIFRSPYDVLIDSETHSLLISDHLDGKVYRFYLNNRIQQGETVINAINSNGLEIDDQGDLYVSDIGSNQVNRFTIGSQKGVLLAGADFFTALPYKPNGPNFIAVDDHRDLYVCDYANSRVTKWINGTRNNTVVVAGSEERGTKDTQLQWPMGIKIDRDQNLYIADTKNNRILRWRKGQTSGDVLIGGIGSNQLNSPKAIAFDRYNNLYVVDASNKRVQRFSYLG